MTLLEIKGLAPILGITNGSIGGIGCDAWYELVAYLQKENDQISVLLRLQSEPFSGLMQNTGFSESLVAYLSSWLMNFNSQPGQEITSEEWQRDYYSLLANELNDRILRLVHRVFSYRENHVCKRLPLSWFLSLLERFGETHSSLVFSTFRLLIEASEEFRNSLLDKLSSQKAFETNYTSFAFLLGVCEADFSTVKDGPNLLAGLISTVCKSHEPRIIEKCLKYLAGTRNWSFEEIVSNLATRQPSDSMEVIADYLQISQDEKYRQLAQRIREQLSPRVIQETRNLEPPIDEFRALLDDKTSLRQTKEMVLYHALRESDSDDDNNEPAVGMGQAKDSLRVSGLDEKLLQAYILNPGLFEKSSATRRSSARSALLKEVDLDHEQLEGWAILFKRNPRMSSIVEDYKLRNRC